MAAAEKAKIGEAMAKCNYVAQDQIWKDHVHQEATACKKWPENWQFLTTKYTDLVKDDISVKSKEKPPTPLYVQPPVTPLNERVTVYPTDKPVPKTASGFIGWRSTEKKLALEKYGGYAKGKGGLVRQLNWPIEAID